MRSQQSISIEGRLSRDKGMLTVSEVAKEFSMSSRYVRRLIAERRIPFHKFGTSVRVSADDVAAFITSGRVEPLSHSDVWVHMKAAA